MNPAPSPPPDLHSESFLHELMWRQLRLSIACAAAFLVVLFALPLLNHFAPEFMALRFAGFTFTWFLLGIGFFPAVWMISLLFIRRSIALENAEVREVGGPPSGPPSAPGAEGPATPPPKR